VQQSLFVAYHIGSLKFYWFFILSLSSSDKIHYHCD
jgi:hypothetical protein